jgi:mono/diheme cytochrome c family protein
MKNIVKSLLLGVTAVAFIGAANYEKTANGADGKSLFIDNKCNQCHTIQSQGIELVGKPPSGNVPPDLSGTGLKHKPDWFSGWLMKEEENTDGKMHLKKWKGSEEDLKTISKWLSSLKKK